jgi:hypothetical protein
MAGGIIAVRGIYAGAVVDDGTVVASVDHGSCEYCGTVLVAVAAVDGLCSVPGSQVSSVLCVVGGKGGIG